MSMRGKWRVVETPDHDLAGPGSYILFANHGGEFALDCVNRGNKWPLRRPRRRVHMGWQLRVDAARNSASSMSGDPLAGPTVATFLALPLRRVASLGRSAASADQNGPDIVDVGSGRAGMNEVADSRKNAVAVMCGF